MTADLLRAQRDAAIKALRALLACVSDKAWTPYEVQVVISEARAVLVEAEGAE